MARPANAVAHRPRIFSNSAPEPRAGQSVAVGIHSSCSLPWRKRNSPPLRSVLPGALIHLKEGLRRVKMMAERRS